jgi:hypothetical protein
MSKQILYSLDFSFSSRFEMSFVFKPDSHWVLRFVGKILGWLMVLNSIVLPLLWFLKILNLFTLILVYEALLISIIGILQVLSSYIYRKNSIPSRYQGRTGWFDFRRFAKLKPKQRQRYRQEGKIMILLGIMLLVVTIILHFSRI